MTPHRIDMLNLPGYKNTCGDCTNFDLCPKGEIIQMEQFEPASAREWFYALPDDVVTEMDTRAGRIAAERGEDGSTAMGFIIADEFTASLRADNKACWNSHNLYVKVNAEKFVMQEQEIERLKQRAEAAERERDEARATVRGWLIANGKDGWIDNMRNERDNLKAELAKLREAASTVLNWTPQSEEPFNTTLTKLRAALQPQVELPAKGEKNG